MNLTLYAVEAFVVLDTEGNRVLAKYYAPKVDGLTALVGATGKPLATLKDQRAFEKGLYAKTKKPTCTYPTLPCYNALNLVQRTLSSTRDDWQCTSTRSISSSISPAPHQKMSSCFMYVHYRYVVIQALIPACNRPR
jgi:hypothetical protein